MRCNQRASGSKLDQTPTQHPHVPALTRNSLGTKRLGLDRSARACLESLSADRTSFGFRG
ncbi:hypothetical protein M3J09_005153 [Ascochyta lentis]